MWTVYDRLIACTRGHDAVDSVMQGENWTMVRTRSGRTGVAATNPARSGRPVDPARFAGMPLEEAAQLVKSWDFEVASVGLAAINAVVNAPKLHPVCENPDAFLRYRDRAAGKKVAVIGRFAYLESRLKGLCDLYVLERRPGPEDYPDPACEYLLPDMDVVFITGCAVGNKTMPRLLQLCQRPFTVISGPSTPMHPVFFELGADALCGLCITDEQACRAAASDCAGIFAAGRMVCLEKHEVMKL
ncbi:MAG: Rossmann-like domain-containing protein [Candidatus Ventricola sp.]